MREIRVKKRNIKIISKIRVYTGHKPKATKGFYELIQTEYIPTQLALRLV